MAEPAPSILILGTRGIPASHGGFETFAERLALYLHGRGWTVGVYCQNETNGQPIKQRITQDVWNGIALLQVNVARSGPVASLEFDLISVTDAMKRNAVCLVLGYNSGVFLPLLRMAGRKVLTNMDGIEWKRPKWSFPIKAWFWVNEWIAAWSSHHLISDNPAITDHLATRRSRSAISTIPYGGREVLSAPETAVREFGLQPQRYFISIARIEPDNNILTIVEAFSRKPRDMKLVVLGTFVDDNPYHQSILRAASTDVIFPGAIYDADVVAALRFHARAYVHGHTVGGTNPSLVEALWAGNAVIAHDNKYNRWTAQNAGFYFRTIDDLEGLLERLTVDDAAVAEASIAARLRAATDFDWNIILKAYEDEAMRLMGSAADEGQNLTISLPS